jgi:hypothetical protein
MPSLLIGYVEGKGRCVYAGEKISKGQSIDTNCVVLFPSTQLEELRPPLVDYPFAWDEKYSCFALGSVALANHSRDNPNAYINRDFTKLLIRLVAKRDIEAGEEITYDYKVPLWFEPKPPARLTQER